MERSPPECVIAKIGSAVDSPLHTIRLRAAWEVNSDGVKPVHSRNFGWPKPLESNEELWLVCANVPGSATVTLNGGWIATSSVAGPFAQNISQYVQSRNKVQFLVESPDPLGEVTLEVRRKVS